MRVFGVTPKLLFYLQQIPKHTLETKCLLQKLLQKIENIHLCSSIPYFPRKLELVKKEYNQLIKEVKESGDVEELSVFIERLGLGLIEGYLADRFYEEALETFQEMALYLQGEKSSLFKVLRANAEMQRLIPDRGIIESLLNQLNQRDWILVNGAMYCFERDDYALSLRILQFLFGNLIPPVYYPTTSNVLDFLEASLLGFNIEGLDSDAWKAVWLFFSECAINTMFPRRILKIKIPYLNQLTASCRLEVAVSTADALFFACRKKESLPELEEALRLSKEVFSEVGLRSVLITL